MGRARPAAAEAHLGLGTNQGDREATMRAALSALAGHGVETLAVSSLYETQPVGEVLDQPDFLNAAALVATRLGPLELLDALKAVEGELGREPGGPRHGPRPIDLDLLLIGETRLDHERLTLPHPELARRRFVLIPLLELDPRIEVPGAGPAADLLAALPEAGQRVKMVGALSGPGE